jgi:hypothetical protein
VDRAARRTAAEKKKEKKDAEKARARERMRAWAALEKRRRRQERDGLPREPSPETPDDDDDDEGLGLSPNLRLGQGLPSQPSGLAPSASRAGTSRSRSEERRQARGVLDPLAEVIEVTPGSEVGLLVPQEQAPALAVQEIDPRAVVTMPGQAVSSAPRAPEAGAAPKTATKQSSAAPAGTEVRGASLQARLALVRSGLVSKDTSVLALSSCALILLYLFLSANGGSARPVWPPGRPLRQCRLLHPVPRRAMPVGWPPHKTPSSGGPRRHELPWDKPPRLTPPSGRPLCRGRLLTWSRPRARLTCCPRRHQLLPRLSLICLWSRPSPLMLGWLRRRCSRSSLTSQSRP